MSNTKLSDPQKTFVSDFSTFVNRASRKEIIECAKAAANDHRTLLQSKMGFCMAFIEELGSQQFDARDEASVLLARKIMECTDSIDRALPFI